MTQSRTGRIENGAVVLADPSDLPEGAQVTVLIRTEDEPDQVSDEELAEIDRGLAEARGARRLDARAFLDSSDAAPSRCSSSSDAGPRFR